jgi:hypothetical protein
MSSKSSVMMSGVVAAIIAIVLIGAVAASGILNTKTTPPATETSGPSGSGTLALLMTDPPTVPNGTSAVYISYSGMAIHLSSAGNSTGWHVLDVKGQIDLMKIINASQTIASASVQNGIFNALEFNITSATVTFENANYSAYLVYQHHTLYVPISGGVSIVNGQTSAAVIDLTPTVLLLGDPSQPAFAFIPAARGYTIPAQSIPSIRVGETVDLRNQTTFRNNQPHFEITGTSLTLTSLSITVTNTGNVSLDFTLAAVTSTMASAAIATTGVKVLPSVASTSEFFVVYPNTTLGPIGTTNDVAVAQMLSGAGYRLPPAASVTFKYTGLITVGALSGTSSTHQIIPGDRYLISITSSDKLAQTITTAQPSVATTTSTASSG